MSLQPAIKALEDAYDKLASLFSEEMPRPMVTVQSSGRRSAFGWFAQDAWTINKDLTPEINISAEHLNRGFDEIMDTLLHEMVHYYNLLRFQRGKIKKRDCNSSHYHNKIFRDGCKEVGLNCEKMGRYGWAKTSLTDELKAKIARLEIDPNAFNLVRLSASPSRQPTKMKKWTCDCGTNVRAAVDLNIVCEECKQKFWRA